MYTYIYIYICIKTKMSCYNIYCVCRLLRVWSSGILPIASALFVVQNAIINASVALTTTPFVVQNMMYMNIYNIHVNIEHK